MPKGRFRIFTATVAVFFAFALPVFVPFIPVAQAEVPTPSTVQDATGKTASSNPQPLPASTSTNGPISGPSLIIPVPDLKLSTIKVQESGGTRYIDVPWIAEYVSGIYKYAIGFATILATVMFMVGGFQYLTAGGDAARVSAGKKRITDALVGLMLVFGCYTILNVVNPDALTLSALRITQVQKVLLAQVDQAIQTTKEPTAPQGSAGAGGTGAGNIGNPVSKAQAPSSTPASLPPPSDNGYSQRVASCPFTEADLGPAVSNDPPNGPRGQAFRSKMRGFMSGDTRTKIAMTAEAGVKCKVHFGSCGSHTATWWSIAGVGPDQLGDNNPNVGGSTAWGGMNHEPPKTIALAMLDVACGTECEGEAFGKQCGETRCTSRQARGANGKMTTFYKVTNDCYGKKDATDEVRALMSGPGGPPGWPDSWTSKLEIGDIIWVYNGNASCGAQHAETFLGWVGGGKAMVAAGQYNGPQWESTECLMRACGRFQVVTRIFKPR